MLNADAGGIDLDADAQLVSIPLVVLCITILWGSALQCVLVVLHELCAAPGRFCLQEPMDNGRLGIVRSTKDFFRLVSKQLCLFWLQVCNTEPNRKIYIFGCVNKGLRFVILLFASAD